MQHLEVVSEARPALAALEFQPPHRELLNFTIRIVTDDYDLQRVQQLRATAYGHHLPHLAADFGKADPLDMSEDVVIFCAEDKATGDIVGSCRIQVNRSSILQIQTCIDTPERLRGKLLSEITRLSVLPGYGDRLVRMALVKACHLHNIAMQVTGIFAGSRRSLMRQYRALGFSDLYGDEREVPLTYSGGLPHRILWLDSVSAEADWLAMAHPFYNFIFRTWHPDISIFTAVHGMSRRDALTPSC